MALVLADRVKESTTTTGTGALTLAGAVDGFQSFATVGDTNTTYYVIQHTTLAEFEVGIGTYTSSGTTLSRDTILTSSNSNNAVNFSAGIKYVFVTVPKSATVYEDESDNVTVAGKITVGAGPTASLDVATKAYVDTATAASIHIHDAVRVEKEGNLTATYNNGTAGVGATLTNSGTQAALVIDGVTLNTSDRVLVYEQTAQTQNGVYVVTDTGSGSTNWVLTRSSDANTSGDNDANSLDEGSYFYVQEGTSGAGESYVCNVSGTITFGTTNITFSQFAATPELTGGTNIDVTGQTISLTGTVDETNGGTGNNAYTLGDTLYSSASNTLAKLAGNTSTTRKYLGQTGTGSVSAAPTWGDLVGDVTGNVTGNAGTATALATGRTISLTGDVTGTSGSFDGTGSVSIAATIAANSVALGTDTTGNYVASGAVSGNGLSGSAASEGASFTVTSNATSSNSGNTIVYRDGSGDFSAGTITASLTGTASNAALLDSIDSSQFLRSDVADTKTSGDLSFSDNVYAIFGSGSDLQIYHDGSNSRIKEVGTGNLIISADNFNVNNASDSQSIIDATSGGAVRLWYAGNTKLATTSSGVSVTGSLTASGDVTAFSDERLKSDIATIEGGLEKVCAMRGVTFTKDGEASSGVIAQEIEKIAPELVTDGEYKSVAYGNLVGYLIEAIKELQAEIQELKGK